jgi:type II secretory pathway pseudopilin PulG
VIWDFGFWVLDCIRSRTVARREHGMAYVPQHVIQDPKSTIRNPGNGGFLMIELVAALAVLTIGLLGVVQTYHFGMDKIRTMRESAIALRAVQNEIETLRALPFANLVDVENGPFVSQTPDLEQLVKATPALTIRPYSDPRLRLKEVAACVRWVGDNGRIMQRAATTLMADKE